MNYKKQVNSNIRSYWDKMKQSLNLNRLVKDKKSSFTRHNGNRIKRLAPVWRYPKGSHGNKIVCPSIGYKRPEEQRYRREVDGLLFRRISNFAQLSKVKLKDKEVCIFSSKLGAKKKKFLLD